MLNRMATLLEIITVPLVVAFAVWWSWEYSVLFKFYVYSCCIFMIVIGIYKYFNVRIRVVRTRAEDGLLPVSGCQAPQRAADVIPLRVVG